MLLHSINFNKKYYNLRDVIKALKEMKLYPVYGRETENYWMFRINEVNPDLKHFTSQKMSDYYYKVYQY